MSKHNLLPPWREIQPSGNLGPEYGPRTPATYAKQCADAKNWAHKKQARVQDQAELVHAFMASGAEVPESELEVYKYMFEKRQGYKTTGVDMGVTRDTVRSYRGRLIARAQDWRKSHQTEHSAAALDTAPEVGSE